MTTTDARPPDGGTPETTISVPWATIIRAAQAEAWAEGYKMGALTEYYELATPDNPYEDEGKL